ncbi:uroporphyrinogen decarboxylase [Thiotrichales bacterium 19S9-12]|nr:uroporphyrinogen decarboxylase [Thiotrichales bacterium 19S9-11]MCF6810751.1 uroporphyrinogen decarboxylase [Thiotrichales bacterium 19S9-12]
MTEYRLVKALKRQPVDKTPIWIMRQAGRYLPEYREIRKQVKDFMSLCKTPDLATEVTLQPLRRFDLDAAILFSDILTIPEAMGLDLAFIEGKGPIFSNPITSESMINELKTVDLLDNLSYVFDAVRMIKRELPSDKPLIGFSGSPWTLASYMIEGSGSKQFNVLRRFLYEKPEAMHNLLEKLSQAISAYLIEQIQSGADVVKIFDTWGGLLTEQGYIDFSLNYMKKIVANVKAAHPSVPVIIFTKGSGSWLQEMAQSGADCVGLDWQSSLTNAYQVIGGQVALEGNLDPAVLYADEKTIEAEVKKILNAYQGKVGHVFNLGHGIYPDIDPAKVDFLVECVHRLSMC